jgi:hypothetical protein
MICRMEFNFPKLSGSQIFRIADISSNLGTVSIASISIGPLFNGITDWRLIIFGLLSAIFGWGFSVLLSKDK